jgi:hypothetical protein
MYSNGATCLPLDTSNTNPTKKQEMNPGAPEGIVDLVPLVTPVVLLFKDMNIIYFHFLHVKEV